MKSELRNIKHNKIKAIFLDWGYTLASSFRETDKEIDAILQPFGLSWKEFFPHWRNLYLLRSLGRVKTDKEMFDLLKSILNLPKEFPADQIKNILVGAHVIEKETIELLGRLKGEYLLGIICNNIHEWVMQTLQEYKISSMFDTVVSSSVVGARKPDARIFKKALADLSVAPEESIFVSDELGEDLVGSKGMGMISIWLDTGVENVWKKPEERFFEPDGVIASWSELPAIIEKIASQLK